LINNEEQYPQQDNEGDVNMQTMTVRKDPLIKDVAGIAHTFLVDIILNIEQAGIFNSMGVSTDKTYGLFGVPGTGKTLAVKALNNQLNRGVYKKKLLTPKEDLIMDDFKLLVFEYNIGSMGTAYINRGSRKVQTFFDKAGLMASYDKKVIVVLDECDAILPMRGGSERHAEDTKVLETLMKNLQILHDTPNMYAVLMSNLPKAIDNAALRAGRIDKKYIFTLPTIEERDTAFNLAIDRANERAKYKVVRNYDAQDLASITKGYSYADIMSTVDDAVRGRAKEVAMDKTKGIMPAAYITQKRLETAVANHTKNFIKVKEKARIGFK